MKPIISRRDSGEVNTEHQAIFIIDNEGENENSRIYLFTNQGVKKIVPEKLDVYNERNFLVLYFFIPEDWESTVGSAIFDIKELPQLKEMLHLAGYCVIASKEGFYIVDSREERNLPPLELQYP